MHLSSFHSVVLFTDGCSGIHRFSPIWGSSLLRSAVSVQDCVAALQKQSGSVTASVLDLFNLDQHRNHWSVHQLSHDPSPASKHPSNTFVSSCMHGIIAHLSHLSVCPLIHLCTDASKLYQHPGIYPPPSLLVVDLFYSDEAQKCVCVLKVLRLLFTVLNLKLSLIAKFFNTGLNV